jgi:3-oxoacyl-[acyl-carrier protein] reductase
LRGVHPIMGNQKRCLKKQLPFQPDPKLLQGRNCLITGSSRGIGKALANELAQYGANIILHGRSENSVASLLKELPQVHPTQKHAYVFGDLEDKETYAEIEQQMKKILTEWNQQVPILDILIHNAAISGKPQTKVEDYPLEDFESIMRINIKAPFFF